MRNRRDQPKPAPDYYSAGFTSLESEISVDELPVTGTIPNWLSGELIRNGPAKFEAGERGFRHWFDGQAMVHRFAFANGTVSYRNRFLDTPALRAARDERRIAYTEFATDPCRSLFSRLFTWYRRPPASQNPSVSVMPSPRGMAALTEVPIAVEFDPESLDTLGVERYDDDLRGNVTTAHPHQAPGTDDFINYVLDFGRKSTYKIYRQGPQQLRRELVGTFGSELPSYMHSFGITEDHVVLAAYPFVVNPLSFLLRRRPFIENYRWRPELGTKFIVMNLADGEVRGVHRTEPFFAFHHINAFAEGGDLVLDTCAYPDASVIGTLYMDKLRAADPVPRALPVRHRIALDTGEVRREQLSDQDLELPTIHYARHNGRPYRYTYGVSRNRDAFFDQLVKLDVQTGRADTWYEPGCYPGEPVFVPADDATEEDSGVVLCVVLEAASARSFMLVLDASSFTELARAFLPHRIPFGIHGMFSGPSN